jgi:hypothetical protein
MNLTHNQHLFWGIEGRLFGTRFYPWERFTVGVGRCVRKPMSWPVEFHLAMEKLVDENGSRLSLFYSGGADSELVLRYLLALGVRPEVHTIEFTGGENSAEVMHAFSFCEAHDLKVNRWKHDVDTYIADEQYLDVAFKYNCTQLAYITVLEYARRVNNPVLMGGEIYVQKHQTPSISVHSEPQWFFTYREDEDGSTYRYSKATGHPIINEVFSYTPELMASWINSPLIRDVLTGRNPNKLSLISTKNAAFEKELGYKLHANTKLHGYEHLMWSNHLVRRKLKDKMIPMQVYRRPLLDFMIDLGVEFEG